MLKSSDSFDDAIRVQDLELGTLHNTVKRIGQTSIAINNELESQNNLLDNLSIDVDHETNQINRLDNKVVRMLKTKNKEWCYIAGLTIVFIGLLLAFIYL